MRYLLALVLFIFMAPFLAFAEDNQVSFSFVPRQGSEVTYQVKETHRYDIPGKKSVQTTTSSQTLLVEKADQAGSRIKVTVGESRLEEDGTVKPVPAIDAMTGRHFRLTAGRDGRVQGMEGLTELAGDIQGAFDNPRVREVVAGLFTEEKLKERFSSEWNARIAPYAGKKVSVGESWYGTEEVYMPFIGTVTLYRKTTLAGLEQWKGKAAVHVVFSWFSDPSTVTESERKTFEGLKGTLEHVSDLAQQGMGVLGQGEAWVEPATMTVLDERQLIKGAFIGLGGPGGKDKPAEGGTVELEKTVTGTVK